jgi:hypothetical protein
MPAAGTFSCVQSCAENWSGGSVSVCCASGLTTYRKTRLLQMLKLREQAQRVQGFSDPKQFLLLCCRQDARGKQSLHWGLRLIVGAPYLAAFSLFRLQLHRGAISS